MTLSLQVDSEWTKSVHYCCPAFLNSSHISDAVYRRISLLRSVLNRMFRLLKMLKTNLYTCCLENHNSMYDETYKIQTVKSDTTQ